MARPVRPSNLTLARLRKLGSERRAATSDRGPTAFVLSGGGNHGIGQIGMLRALLERDIVPDVVVGCSAGAMNGAAIAADASLAQVDRLQETWLALDAEKLFPGGALVRTWNILRHSTHMVSNEGLVEVIRRLAPPFFADLRIPLRVVACDFRTGDEVVLASGALEPALLASSALPGVYPPVLHDGMMLVDGGVCDNVPIGHALGGPVARIYVLDISGNLHERPIRHPVDALMQAFAISRKQRWDVERDLANAAYPDVEVIELPRPDDHRSSFDYTNGQAVIDDAHERCARFLDAKTEAEAVAEQTPRRARWTWWRSTETETG